MTQIGHNSDPQQRREYVRRFKTLFEDARETAEELRDLGKEAVTKGLNPKVLKLLAREEMNPKRREARKALEADLETYQHALGILD